MSYALYSQTTLFSITILLIVSYKSTTSAFDRSLGKKLFTAALWCSVAAIASEFLWSLSLIDGVTFPKALLWIFNFMYFAFFELSAYLWYLCVDSISAKPLPQSKKRLAVSFLPAVLMLVLLILSVRTGWVFTIDGALVYKRGPLYFLQIILSFGYIVAAAAKAYKNASIKGNYSRRKELLSIPLYSVPILLGGVLQVCTYELPISSVGFAVSFSLLYLNFLLSAVRLDPLTGIGNYRETISYLTAKVGKLRQCDNFYLFFLDIDYFKQVNDTYGHRMGDELLKGIASTLEEICAERHGFCSRYGGDEFVLTQDFENDSDIEEYRETVRRAVEENCRRYKIDGHSIGVSIGYARYEFGGDSVHDLILRADRSMYNEKRQRKIAEESKISAAGD